MSSIGQSIRNNFPLWSKIRRDDSSVGAILFDNIGKLLEESRFDMIKKEYQSNVLSVNPVCEPGNMFIFSLAESNAFNTFKDENKTYDFLLAKGVKAGVEYDLENVYSYSSLSLTLPTRIEVNVFNQESYLIASIVKNENVELQHRYIENSFYFNSLPTRIYINIFDSTNYEISTYDRNLYDKKYVTIRGTDVFGKNIEETINVTKDGFYKSSNIFRTIENLEKDLTRDISGGPSFECYGFDGEVEILRYPLQVGRKEYKPKLLAKKVDEINLESSLEENVCEFRIKGSNTLQYIFNVYSSAEHYLNKRNEPLKEYFEQIFLEQNLLSSSEGELSVQDFCLDYVRNKLVCIDSLGILRWYSIGKNEFSRPRIQRTKKSNITFESEKQQVVLEETLPMFVSLERAKGNVSEVIIARQRPSFRDRINLDANGELVENFNFEYLQEDLSWSEEKYFFTGKDVEDIYLNFEGKTINTYFGEYGQHDFYVISFANEFNRENSLDNFMNGTISEETFRNHLLKHLRDEQQETVLIDTYSVFCESLKPLKEFETGILEKLEAESEDPEEFSLGVFLEGHSNECFIIASNEMQTYAYKVKEYKDYILYDNATGEAALIEEYDSVKINLNGSFEEEVFYNG